MAQIGSYPQITQIDADLVVLVMPAHAGIHAFVAARKVVDGRMRDHDGAIKI